MAQSVKSPPAMGDQLWSLGHCEFYPCLGTSLYYNSWAFFWNEVNLVENNSLFLVYFSEDVRQQPIGLNIPTTQAKPSEYPIKSQSGWWGQAFICTILCEPQVIFPVVGSGKSAPAV